MVEPSRSLLTFISVLVISGRRLTSTMSKRATAAVDDGDTLPASIPEEPSKKPRLEVLSKVAGLSEATKRLLQSAMETKGDTKDDKTRAKLTAKKTKKEAKAKKDLSKKNTEGRSSRRRRCRMK